MIIKMPRWQSYMATTTEPMFSPEQCQNIIDAGHAEKPQTAQVGMNKPGGGVDKKKRTTTISWIPFDKLPQMYKKVEHQLSLVNLNHFGFGDIQVTENAQFTEYPVGGFYDWHMDCDVNMQHEPPVRKISMTLLLNDPSEFKGGDLELMAPGKFAELKQGHAIIFASFLNHRVNPVTEGIRQSLVCWFGGKPFR